VETTTLQLPDDVADLKRLAAEQFQAVKERDKRIQRLEGQLALLRKMVFGSKSEKLKPAEDQQGRLFNEAEVYARSASAQQEELPDLAPVKSHNRKKAGRKPIPDNLPREEVLHDLSDAEKICECGQELSRIGEDVSEEIELIPQSVIVKKHIRPKYTCRHCEGLTDETKPALRMARILRLLPGSIASPSLLVHVLISKFCDALPFYRQEKIFARHGLNILRTTMCNWTVRVAERLAPLRSLMETEIKAGPCIGIDETVVQVLKEPERRPEQKSYMWVMRGGDPDHPLILYEYRISRSGDFLADRLSGYHGTIVTDGYGGYDYLASLSGIELAACWAHVRRYFFQAHELAKSAEGPLHVLAEIKKLYRIEESHAQSGPSRRRKARERESVPIIEALHEFLEKEEAQVVPSSRYGKAIRYARESWPRLLTYTRSGTVPIDNNPVENAIRPFVVGRKNWMFFDTQDGATAGTLIYSLIESARANGLEPYHYLQYLFEKFPLVETDQEAARELLPNRVTPAQIEAHFTHRGEK
jgi:transposase